MHPSSCITYTCLLNFFMHYALMLYPLHPFPFMIHRYIHSFHSLLIFVLPMFSALLTSFVLSESSALSVCPSSFRLPAPAILQYFLYAVYSLQYTVTQKGCQHYRWAIWRFSFCTFPPRNCLLLSVCYGRLDVSYFINSIKGSCK